MLRGKNRNLFVLFLLLGLLFTLEARVLSKGVKYVGAENLAELSRQVDTERAAVEQLRQSKLLEKEKLTLLESPSEDNYDELLNTLKTQKSRYEKILSYTDVEGPGVIVIIDDSDRELFQGENGNNVLVHDADLNVILDELRMAGAEALSINGRRIIYGRSEVVCVGPTVTVDNEQMGAPYIIKAIGNRKHLEAAINAPGGYAEILESFGLFLEVNTSISVNIDKYEGEIDNLYMEYYEEGDE